MFTGLIKELGTILNVRKEQGRVVLTIKGHKAFQDLRVDDSVSVNGCCLTTTKIEGDEASFDVLPETLRLTNLGYLKSGDRVNLEDSLTLQSKIGGHIIQGHVDGLGKVMNSEFEGDALVLSFSLADSLLAMIVPKGFVSIDGISLTVTRVDKQSFGVMIIPHTRTMTNAQNWQEGSLVNIEIDGMNKATYYYIQKILSSKEKECKQI